MCALGKPSKWSSRVELCYVVLTQNKTTQHLATRMGYKKKDGVEKNVVPRGYVIAQQSTGTQHKAVSHATRHSR